MNGSGTVWVCPVDGCGRECRTAEQLRGHMAGTMQNDPAHRWQNVPISHHDLSAAKRTVPGLPVGDGDGHGGGRG